MKILFLSHTNTIGGAELSLVTTIKFLKSQGFMCYVILSESPKNQLGNLLAPICEQLWHVPFTSWPKRLSIKNLKLNIKHAYIEYRAVKKISTIISSIRIDVIHTNTVHTRIGIIVSKKYNIPHVMHLREITGESKEARLFIHGQNKSSFKNRWGAHKGLLANSLFTLQANKHSFLGKIEYVLHNSLLHGPKNTTVIREPQVIGMVANVTSKCKRHPEFVKIAIMYNELFPGNNLKFHIYGQLPNENDPYLIAMQEEVESAKMNDKIVFKGLMSSSDIYEEMDILIHPYPYESFGRIFIEAMATGIPVITARGGGASEILTNQVNGLLYNDQNREEACSILNLLVNSKKIRNNIIENGLKRALDFTPEKVYEKLPEFYRKVIQ